MALANQQAEQLRHEYIGTEHILLGLCREDVGIAGDILDDLIEGGREAVYAEVLNLLGCEAAERLGKKLPIDMAIEEAVANQDFETAAKMRDSKKKNTDNQHKEVLRQIACVLLGHIKEDYGTKITLDAIKKVLDEYDI